LLSIRWNVAHNENERYGFFSISRVVNFFVSVLESYFHCLVCRDVCSTKSWFFINKVL
jgi:hypothetical protein